MIVFGYKNKAERILRGLIFAALGIMFLFFPDTWVSGAAFLIGVRLIGLILVVLGGFEVVVLLGALSVSGVGFLPFLLGIGTVLLGLSMLFTDSDFRFIKFLAGLALLWYGISDLISGWKIGRAIEEYEIKRTKEAQPSQPDSPASSGTLTVSDLDAVKDAEFRKEE